MSVKREEEGLKSGHITTLDEPVMDTIMRDLKQVAEKLKVVLLPLNQNSSEDVLNKLKDWELWGPLLVCLFLSSVLSITAPGQLLICLTSSHSPPVFTSAIIHIYSFATSKPNCFYVYSYVTNSILVTYHLLH